VVFLCRQARGSVKSQHAFDALQNHGYRAAPRSLESGIVSRSPHSREPTPTLSHTHSTVVITPIYLFADDRDIALRRIKYPIPFEKEPVQYLFELFLGRWRQVARNHYDQETDKVRRNGFR